jgi:hypothetical protein
LHDVFGPALILDDGSSGPVHPLGVAPHQDFEEGRLPGDHLLDDLLVGHAAHASRTGALTTCIVCPSVQ